MNYKKELSKKITLTSNLKNIHYLEKLNQKKPRLKINKKKCFSLERMTLKISQIKMRKIKNLCKDRQHF